MRFITIIQYCLPQHLLSRLIGAIAKCRWRWLKNLLIRWFCKCYNIDLSTAKEQNISNYACFNEFFTRALKPNARPIATATNAIISPVDGHISQIGSIDKHQIIQAKGHKFTLADLIGTEHAPKFINGNFATLYLSPQDYHRVHMPISGKLEQMLHIPGKLFSVQPDVINNVPNLYARNERVVNIFQTTIGPVAVIMIGAILVASIETVWAGEITPPTRKQILKWNYTKQNIQLDRGAEMGRFQFGSTVIILFPENTISWNTKLKPENKVNMGQTIGEIL